MAIRRGPAARIGETASLLLAVVLVFAVAIFAWRAWLAIESGNAQRDATFQVFESVNSLLSSLKDAETGQRGFLLTGEDRYLEPYRMAIANVPSTLDALARADAAPGRATRDGRVERLRPLVQAKLDELAQTIGVRRRDGISQALVIVRTDRGKAIMDQIRAVCAGIQTVSREALRRETEAARRSANQAGLIGTVGSAVVFLLLVLATVNVRNGTARRQQLIAALQESEGLAREARDWLGTTLASIGDAVIATDPRGRVTFMNAVAESLTGWTGQEAAGKPLETIFVITNEDTGALVENPVDKALREGRIVGLANHTKLTAKSGAHVPIDDSAAPIRSAAGDIAGVVLVFRDVTERKAAESALQRSIEHFRLMADNAPVLIWMAGLDGRYSWFNKPWLDFAGRDPAGEAAERWLENVHPEDRERCVDAYQSAFSARDAFTREYRMKRHDGEYRYLFDQGTPLHDTTGFVTGYIGSCIDITDRKKVEDELRVANDDLSQFAFAASHDLQEPLRMITSYAQLLIKGYRGNLDGEAGTCVEYIMDGTRRMRELLADLLAYTQLTGDGPQPVEPVDLNVVFRNAVENCGTGIEESHPVVTSDPLPMIAGHPQHFLQLFQNLIGNAIKYRDPSRPPRVHVKAEREGDFWHFSVEDNGIGIEPEYHRKIFGVFKRLHGRVIPGTGIGLAICQRVVERYGGKIRVESELDHGATFHFTLTGESGARP